eukprot:11149440-Ditylum_brightwellii.AAC.1
MGKRLGQRNQASQGREKQQGEIRQTHHLQVRERRSRKKGQRNQASQGREKRWAIKAMEKRKIRKKETIERRTIP